MYIRLIRNKPRGNAIFGRLYVDSLVQGEHHQYAFATDTLEHYQYAIPTGCYRLRITQSAKFGELLPILDGVFGFARPNMPMRQRVGIRIHAGNIIQHSTGCILVGTADTPNQRLLSSRKALNKVREYLLNYQKQNPHEEIFIEISEPDAYPLYDMPCQRQL
ncbi:MAG: hypothetical protein IKW47_01720 [Alistipes sp.]|nr:hypothetical protein [Alistipes sp.]